MSTSQKQWFSAAELIGLPDMPGTTQNINAKAKREGWTCRKREGRGGGFEYHLNSLPPATKAKLLAQQGKIELNGTVLNAPKPKAARERYDAASLWQTWERAGEHAQSVAKAKLAYVSAFYALVESGTNKMAAYEHIAVEFGLAVPTLRRDCKKVAGFDKADWAPQLLTKNKIAAMNNAANRLAPVSDEAWEWFKTDYLRLEQPNFATSYWALLDTAKKHNWEVPSVDSLKRRLDKEVPHEQQVMLRQGEHALMQLYPAQQRTVLDIEAMEWINGDGYQHNVFVRWHNGEILRPKTWFWADIRTRKILAWRVGVSENTDTIRLSLMDVVNQYGIPKQLTLDNTRAAANKWMTGGVPNRYRFKVKPDDPMGLIPMLGIQLHWSSVLHGKGHGQAKPIERAFGVGGLGEFVDKNIAFEGAYTGANPNAKPDNYGSTAVAAEVFMRVLAEGVQTFNQRPNRETEVCRGVMSFDEAFAASYQNATVRKATAEQKRMLLLSAEAVRVSSQATIVLDAGGAVASRKNRYHHEALYSYVGQKIVARFDPDNLHGMVVCYTLSGLLICEANCIQATGFGDTDAAREHTRHRTQFTKANKLAAKAHKRMSNLEAAELMRGVEPEPPLTPAATEMVHIRHGNTVRTVAAQPEAENFEEAFALGVSALFAEKNKNRL